MPKHWYTQAREQGLLMTSDRKDWSAKDLYEKDPALAAKWADFLVKHKADMIRDIAGLVHSRQRHSKP
jgi:hypothetical protein